MALQEGSVMSTLGVKSDKATLVASDDGNSKAMINFMSSE